MVVSKDDWRKVDLLLLVDRLLILERGLVEVLLQLFICKVNAQLLKAIVLEDLKPENVLFTDNTRSQVKIIDFGSACTEFKGGFEYV